ncbi:hypothetical protein G6F42_024801 [Rhizopus arrhizus]|nr:hypothetical protein G6F42_024801 [Rhizopus arrhizus]
MAKKQNKQKIPASVYVDKNKNKRYNQYMKYHRERVCMQRATRRIIERRALLTNMPIVLREQALKDADKLLS